MGNSGPVIVKENRQQGGRESPPACSRTDCVASASDGQGQAKRLDDRKGGGKGWVPAVTEGTVQAFP